MTRVGKTTETAHLWMAIWILVVLSAYRVMTHLADPLREYLGQRTDLPLVDAMVNGLFFWLLALLWLAYHRWREAIYRRRDLEKVITSISPDVLLVVDRHRTLIPPHDMVVSDALRERRIIAAKEGVRNACGQRQHDALRAVGLSVATGPVPRLSRR